jgi:RNA polymerase sigma-70 factor (ECF subfamily)
MPAEQVKTDDTELVKRAKANDSEAFAMLVDRYQSRVFNTAYRMMGERGAAEDITQEVFLKVYSGLPTFKEQAAFSTWIYRITVNQCTSEVRRLASRKRRQEVSLHPVAGNGSENPIEPPDTSGDPVRKTEESEKVEVVQRAIESLDPEFREALVLRDIEGFSYEEIAEIIQRPVGTVRSRIHRARTELREKLRKYVGKAS